MINLLIVGSIFCLLFGYLVIVVLVDAAPVIDGGEHTELDPHRASLVEFYPRLIWSPPPGQVYDEGQAVAAASETLVEDLYYDENCRRAK